MSLWDYGRIDPPMPAPEFGQYYDNRTETIRPFLNRLGLPDDFADTVLRLPCPARWGLHLTFGDGDESGDPHDDDVSLWHVDCSDWRYVAVWSTNGPTEVRSKRGQAARLGVKHLTVFDNHKMQHRTGRYRLDFSTRYFFRAGIDHALDWRPDPRLLAK